MTLEAYKIFPPGICLISSLSCLLLNPYDLLLLLEQARDTFPQDLPLGSSSSLPQPPHFRIICSLTSLRCLFEYLLSEAFSDHLKLNMCPPSDPLSPTSQYILFPFSFHLCLINHMLFYHVYIFVFITTIYVLREQGFFASFFYAISQDAKQYLIHRSLSINICWNEVCYEQLWKIVSSHQ